MRGRFALLVLALSLSSSGCIVVRNISPSAPTTSSEAADDAGERLRNRQWAETAWQQNCTAHPQQVASPDYAQGFKDGFAEHLYTGQEQPPRSAPSRYRAVQYQTPQGYRGIEDWFAGYRHGIAAAIESGCRRWIAGPVGDGSPARATAPIEIIVPAPARKGAAMRLVPARMPNDAPQAIETANPEIQFGKPQSAVPSQPAPKNVLLAPVGVDREGDLPPPAVVPPPTLGGPRSPRALPSNGPTG